MPAVYVIVVSTKAEVLSTVSVSSPVPVSTWTEMTADGTRLTESFPARDWTVKFVNPVNSRS